MEKTREVGFAVMMLSHQLRRYVDEHRSPGLRLTHMQGRILGMLDHSGDKDVFQRDLERTFQVRRSTATAILQVMERDGLITRRPVPYDARLKKLVLTDKARRHCAQCHEELEQMEAQLSSGLSEEELERFFSTVDKLMNNLGVEEKQT
ncbi:MAG: MarR family winged helix-turn-helix transcriptional regulator [Eubacteriales bacterium]|nr:MarR family winged helix-turn-helix transcriptional regulator [Eubacteriales bacterium]